MLIVVVQILQNDLQQKTLRYWIISQSKGFARQGIRKVSKSVWIDAYLVLHSQVKARTDIVNNSGYAVYDLKVYKNIFSAVVNEDYFIDDDIAHC